MLDAYVCHIIGLGRGFPNACIDTLVRFINSTCFLSEIGVRSVTEGLSILLTIIVIILTIYNTILFYRQAKLTEKQTLIERSQVYPLVKIEDVDVKGDLFRLKLKNKAHMPAYQLGVEIYFTPCSLEKGQLEPIDEIPWINGNNAKKAYPRRVIIPLKNKKGKARLYDKEEDIYEADAFFLFNTSKKELASGKADSFAELKQRLTKQGIRFVAVLTALVYKDVSETVIEFEAIRDFTIDFAKHNTLEDAWRENIPYPFHKTVGYEEVSFFDYDVYMHYKDYRGRLEPLG